ncbi:MAG TPA: fructose-bisphosphatase class II family protein [Anaerolineae bacterium]|nr:fructose-bisphosphatase class II family protein [Anaerolineae bacterium]HMR67045.1 fructose-bisphosphatase class II family protein [Anaerolineae bacterium]
MSNEPVKLTTEERILPNLGLDLVRATEFTALHVGRWLGLGNRERTHRTATYAMFEGLNWIDMDGQIVIGEEGRLGYPSPLDSGRSVGTGHGPKLDVIVDPIDGTNSVVRGRPGAISVIGVAPRGSMWSPTPAIYMDKIVVDHEGAEALLPECMDAPAAWTLALIARAKKKSVRDLQIIVLDRPRHRDLIDEIRAAGARVLLHFDGDTAGALVAATPGAGADILMGIGGVPEGVSAACAVKAMGGAMLGRLAPQSPQERESLEANNLSTTRILSCDDIVSSNQILLAVTGITPGPLLDGVRYKGREAHTHSLLIRCESGTRRRILAEHSIDWQEFDEKLGM